MCRLHAQCAEVAGLARIGHWAIRANGGRIPPGVGGMVLVIREQVQQASALHAQLRVVQGPGATAWRETGFHLRRVRGRVAGEVRAPQWRDLAVDTDRAWFASARLALGMYGGPTA